MINPRPGTNAIVFILFTVLLDNADFFCFPIATTAILIAIGMITFAIVHRPQPQTVEIK